MFKTGDIVKYSPKFCGPGEELYIHIVVEADRGRYLISTLNSLLTLGSTERVDEEMIRKAEKYEVINNRDIRNRKCIITDTSTRKFFAGYDPMGSVNWVDNDSEANGMDHDEAESVLADLISAE